MVILIRGDKMNKKAAILLLKGYEFIVEEVYDLGLGFREFAKINTIVGY